MLLRLIILATTIEAAAVGLQRVKHHRNAQPGSPVQNSEAVQTTASSTSSSSPADVTVLSSHAEASPSLAGGLLAVDASVTVAGVSIASVLPETDEFTPSPTTASASSTDCTPMSICVDGYTCSKRWGHCYDKNYCHGSTAFPTPSCDSSPAEGLTQNNIRLSNNREIPDIAASVIMDSLVAEREPCD